MKEEEIKQLEWVYNRMRNHHGESDNLDYMIKFNQVINNLRTSDANRSCGLETTDS
jgi:hypothetical protein